MRGPSHPRAWRSHDSSVRALRAVPECFDVWPRQRTKYDQPLIGNLDLSIDEREPRAPDRAGPPGKPTREGSSRRESSINGSIHALTQPCLVLPNEAACSRAPVFGSVP
jgi:hypothetical protein